MNYGIAGRTALLTGGAGGIGMATARLLVGEGARVILVDLERDDVDRGVAELGADARGYACDLTSGDQVAALKDRVASDGDMPSILVCNAGVTGAKGHPLELADAEYQEAWDTDFMSVLRTMRAFVPAMESAGWGRVVAVSSENAAQPYPDEAPYNVAKIAMVNFVKGLSQVCAPNGVMVNTVAPAFIETPMTDQMMDGRAEEMGTDRDTAIETFLEEERPFLTMKRRGRPEEVAAAIAFLCSDQASFVSGANYRVDGGSVGAISI